MAMVSLVVHVAAAVLLLLSFSVVLQGCGGGDANNVEDADVPSPMGLDVEPGKGGQSGPPTTWECTVETPMAASHTWTIPANKLSSTVKGQAVKSESFHMPPFPGDFALYYFPQGDAKATDGHCSAYVSSSVAMSANLEMSANDAQHFAIVGKWKAGGTNGFTDFGDTPEGGVTLTMWLREVPPKTSSTQDPNIVTKKVLDENNTVVEVWTYTCWTYALSDTPDVSWLQVQERYLGTQACTKETIRDAQKTALETRQITSSQGECDGNDVLLTRKNVATCTIPYLKSQHCSTPSSFLQRRKGKHQVSLVADEPQVVPALRLVKKL